ncbi:MAG: AAA family ATPase [Malacoplasma sp.]|nr:AAA family ATPase [Malacoplasma sp.]MDE7112511.1 AAA family ATPase [Malacoplasma sp.]
MIFLKKFEAIGFKSFADFTKLNFDSTMIGVVGPNGSGKSNVIDAIKWVLGEQSIKSLRGKKSDDIIFHGSKTKEACDYAQVTLTFDNSKKHLHFDADEVSVSRKLYRGNGNNEYYVNGQITRLKDIHDIFSDTGLSKGSLGIISQGTVNWFADSKPEERRTIFEEAAGISKYIRKKEESLRQLERTQNNLNRVNDLTKELYKDIKKLELQASKAKEYSEKKAELTKLEISILVKDILDAQQKLESVQSKLLNSRSTKEDLGPKLNSLITQLNSHKNLLSEVEIKADKFAWELNNIKDKISQFEVQKSIFDNDLALDINSSDFQSKVEALESKIFISEKELKTNNEIIERNKNELNQFTKMLDDLKYEEKILEKEILDLSKLVAKQESELEHLSDILKSKPTYAIGVKSILENRKTLTGILGCVIDFVKCEEQYEKAITIALGKNTQNIVTNTSRDVKRAIDFLVNNKAGLATFMPIYDITVKPMRDEHKQIVFQLDGFIGIASELIKCDKKIQPVFDVLLNKVLIAENFEKALEISKYTYQLYKIVTLDGQIINPHGVITGGYSKQLETSSISLDKKINAIKKELDESKKTLSIKENRKSDVALSIIDTDAKLRERKVNLGIYSTTIKTISDEIVRLKTEYQKCTKKSFDKTENESNSLAKDLNDLIERLNSLNNTKEKVINEFNANEATKKELRKSIFEIEKQIEETRNTLNTSTDVIVELTETEVNNRNKLDFAKQKLSDTYKMTVESAIENFSAPLEMSDAAARNKIEKLSKEIGYIGPINMEAVSELKEKSERYEKMHNEELEIEQAKENILNVIKELDQKAHEDFERTILRINEELPKTFRYLFGGGSCSIDFTDPTDILTSGIDIKANPPGKHVNSLFALSGGEKTLVALSVLFSILKVSSFPLVVLDEAESALDPSNVERFGDIISAYSKETQFIVITHREGTMLRCEKLYGATMQQQGVTIIFQSKVQEAKQFMSELNENNEAEN